MFLESAIMHIQSVNNIEIKITDLRYQFRLEKHSNICSFVIYTECAKINSCVNFQ